MFIDELKIFSLIKKQLITRNLFGFKFVFKLIFKFLIFFYSFSIIPISLFFLLILSVNYYFSNSKKKYISLRISKKYFGHHAIEPAIASSMQMHNTKKIVIISNKDKYILGNPKLTYLVDNSFKLTNDVYLKIIENLYNFSFNLLKDFISKYYEPLIPKWSKYREIKYWPLLDLNKNFIWRTKSIEMLNKNNFANNRDHIVIALRSSHFHKFTSTVQSQTYRNADLEDLIYLIKACDSEFKDKEIICYCSYEMCRNLSKIIFKNNLLRFVPQEKFDILDILTPSSLLISNANGIGATAFAMGIKTLFLQHSPWHVWFTSHSNSLMLPIEYKTLDKNKLVIQEKRNLDNIIDLAFSPSDYVPFDYERNFLSKNIIVQKIKQIDFEILKATIREASKIYQSNDFRQTGNYSKCEFKYSSTLEKIFWEKYLNKIPRKMIMCHSHISMSISTSFLQSFYK